MGAAPDDEELRSTVADACRILAHRGLVEGVLGHVSACAALGGSMLLRCRGRAERGLGATTPADVRAVGLDGTLRDSSGGWELPKEWPIHAVFYRDRPEVRAVVHAHPLSTVLCGLAGLKLRPVIGAYNIPALRMAERGVPVYPRSVLITRLALAEEMFGAMGSAEICLLKGHGVTVVGRSVEEATVKVVNLDALCRLTVDLARIGATPTDIPPEDLAELPDLGGHFNDRMAWDALLWEADHSSGT